MKSFTDRFKDSLVKEAVGDDVPMTDAEAAANELEPGTDPSMLDVEAPEMSGTGDIQNPAQDIMKAQNREFSGKIQEWVTKVEDFIDYLNGIGPESVNSQINSAPCDTIMDDISRSETKKIGRIAQDLRSLSESLKSYLIANED